MQYLQQIIFALVLAVAIYFFARNVGTIRKNILSGRDLDRSRAQGVDLLRVEGRGRGQEPEETDQRWEKGDSEESEDEIHGAHS